MENKSIFEKYSYKILNKTIEETFGVGGICNGFDLEISFSMDAIDDINKLFEKSGLFKTLALNLESGKNLNLIHCLITEIDYPKLGEELDSEIVIILNCTLLENKKDFKRISGVENYSTTIPGLLVSACFVYNLE